MIRRLLLPLLLLVLLVAPVAAVEEAHFENVHSFQAAATDSLTINSVRLEGLSVGSNQTVIANAYGDVYQLGVRSWRSAGWMKFNISCLFPDGHTEYRDLSAFKPGQPVVDGVFGTKLDAYNLNIQYYFSTAGTTFDTDVYVGLLPLSTQFYSQIPENDSSYSGSLDRITILAFSQVLGTSTSEISKVTVYYVTAEEFEAAQENDPLLRLFHGAESLFNWTWDGVVYLVGKIPGVGPHLETFLTLVGFTLEEIAFWLNLFFIEYPELTIGAIEFLIIADAVTNTRSLWKLLQRIVDDHIKIGEFFLNLIVHSIDLISRIISAVSNIISTIKPFG